MTMAYPQAWHIASYPRSGNHLVRAVLEAYTGRPTEGCPGSKHDTPIHTKAPNASGLIQITSDQPVGYKSHTLQEIHQRDRQFHPTPLGFILVTRDPVAAIVSHTVRSLSNKRKYPWLNSRRKNLVVQKNINDYLSLVHRFAATQCAPKIHIKFEDLLNPKTSQITTTSLLHAVGIELQGPALNDVFALAKESQNSLGRHDTALKTELEQRVAEKISYADVLRYIDGF
jgi:hypothetical protein